ncbi:uncharacterized protein LOC114543598 [Dendronephthya gigantea]|uniref:uncharacterized protein LOC114543598 n=1 Tax=Dendronephthya gigantea TaxID=151771 RepID=UPI00106A3EB8|nr:uncharacterized protein LOC114543598 [Dendronephthya gigantea]
MADGFANFLSSLNFTALYSDRFKDTGYDDIGLLIDATNEELNQMFDIVGMSTKPGHVLKFKKSLESLKLARTIKTAADKASVGGSLSGLLPEKNLNLQATNIQKPQVERMNRQKTISFVTGKFVVGGDADVKNVKPWEKFYIPNVKTDRFTYYNSITENVYKSAYSKKQSSFQAYLEGQRKFRRGIKVELENIQKVFESYQRGVVPKENINLERYQFAAIPADVKVEDVSKCQRAWKHMEGTLFSVRNMKEKLMGRRKELLD